MPKRKDRDRSVVVNSSTTHTDEDDYASQQYWDRRYQTNAGYHSWYYSFDDLLPFFTRILGEGYLMKGADVLEIGCGDSPLIHHFAPPNTKQTAPHLFGIDYSPTIVSHLQATLTHRAVCFSEMDAGATHFTAGKFALVIDKGGCAPDATARIVFVTLTLFPFLAGTIDALLGGKRTAFAPVLRVVREAMRVRVKADPSVV